MEHKASALSRIWLSDWKRNIPGGRRGWPINDLIIHCRHGWYSKPCYDLTHWIIERNRRGVPRSVYLSAKPGSNSDGVAQWMAAFDGVTY